MLRGPNNPWLVACWFGALKAGRGGGHHHAAAAPGEITTIAEMARVDLALCDHRFVDDVAAADVTGLRILSYGGDGDDDLSHRTAGTAAEFSAVQTAADDVALLAFTSGTTGRPKATMHFHRDVLANADTFSRHVLRPSADDVFTGTPPLAFTFGTRRPGRLPASGRGLDAAAREGRPGGVRRPRRRARGHRLLHRADGVPGHAGRRQGPQLKTLRRCVSAGEHLPASVWHAFHDATGIAIIDGIGATEMLHIFISRRRRRHPARLDRQGGARVTGRRAGRRRRPGAGRHARAGWR
jgi:2-aminobenzoate-CoA ligase